MGLLKKLLAILVSFFLGCSIVLLNSVNVTDVFLQPEVVKSIILDPEVSISGGTGGIALAETVKADLQSKLQEVNVTDQQFERLMKCNAVRRVYAEIGEAVVSELRQVPSNVKTSDDITDLCTREISKVADEVEGLEEIQIKKFTKEFSSIMERVYNVLTSPSKRTLIPHLDIVQTFRGILIAAVIAFILLLKVGLGKLSKALRTAGVIMAAVTIPFTINLVKLLRMVSQIDSGAGSSPALNAVVGLNYSPLMLRTRFTAITGVVLIFCGIYMGRREYIMEDGTIPVVLEDKAYFEEKNIL